MVSFDFFDLGIFEEEDFHAFDFGRVFEDRFHYEGMGESRILDNAVSVELLKI